MSDPISTAVVIKVNQELSPGTVQIKHFTSQERLLRALKAFGFCWGAALVSVFIPLAHFILVPSFFLAGLIAPYFFYSTESLVLGGKGSCPKCKTDLVIEKGSNQWPLFDLCTACKSRVEIVKQT